MLVTDFRGTPVDTALPVADSAAPTTKTYPNELNLKLNSRLELNWHYCASRSLAVLSFATAHSSVEVWHLEFLKRIRFEFIMIQCKLVGIQTRQVLVMIGHSCSVANGGFCYGPLPKFPWVVYSFSLRPGPRSQAFAMCCTVWHELYVVCRHVRCVLLSLSVTVVCVIPMPRLLRRNWRRGRTSLPWLACWWARST